MDWFHNWNALRIFPPHSFVSIFFFVPNFCKHRRACCHSRTSMLCSSTPCVLPLPVVSPLTILPLSPTAGDWSEGWRVSRSALEQSRGCEGNFWSRRHGQPHCWDQVRAAHPDQGKKSVFHSTAECMGTCEGLESGIPEKLIALRTAESGECKPCASDCHVKGSSKTTRPVCLNVWWESSGPGSAPHMHPWNCCQQMKSNI